MTRQVLERENAELRAQLEALRRSEAIFKRLHQTRIDAFARTSLDGHIEEFNDLFRQMVGYEAGELYGMHYRHLTPEKWHAVEAEIINEVLKHGQSRLYEKEYRRKDRTVFPIEIRAFLIRHPADNAPAGIAAVVRDISDRKRAEEALAHLSGRLIDAQEAERARVACELHDDFSQRLALLAVNLDLVRQSLGEEEDVLRSSVHNLHAQVQMLARDVRRMSHDLHPARLEQLGLASALRGLCTELSVAHGVPIRCEARDVPRDLPRNLALCFYRVAQEALQNVVKHAGASSASVALVAAGGELGLVVRDDGRGFDVSATGEVHSLGLANIRERVRSIGGRLTIWSMAGGGTRIEVRAALEADAIAG